MKAYQNKKGGYYCRAYDSILGKTVTVHGKTASEAKKNAAIYSLGVQRRERSGPTFAEAMEQFVENRRNTFSPHTLREYISAHRLYLMSLDAVPVENIANEVLQKIADSIAAGHKEKTVKNIMGVAVSVIKSVRPDMRFNLRYKPSEPHKVELPAKEQISALLAHADDDMKLCIKLAVYGGLRRAEIAALAPEDLSPEGVNVNKAYAIDQYNRWVVKSPKTKKGYRFVSLPSDIAEEIRARFQERESKDSLVGLMPNQISDRFIDIAKRANVKCTFHQLRHWSASWLHSQGVTDQELLERFGWSSQTMFNVYRHTIYSENKSEKALHNLCL